jgi:RNA polymerase sigma-70 factor (ECF subfamily)
VDRLYRDHARKLLVYFARRTFDPEVATDLVAETFASAFRDRRQYRGHSPEEAAGWLYGIARHQLTGYYKRGSVEREALKRIAVEPRDLSDAELERVDELAGLAEVRARVGQRLKELEPGDRKILRMRIVEELGYEEIADQLDLTEQAARARVSRALRRLRSSLDEIDDPAADPAGTGAMRT